MARANSWTAEEEAWLREVYPTHHNAEIAAMHAERFPDRPRRTDKSINSRAKVYGLHKAPDFKRNEPRVWTPERVEWLRAYAPGHHEGEIIDAFEERFGIRLTKCQLKNAKAKHRALSGTKAGQFESGRDPWNKGRTWDELGIPPESRARCATTQFKAGEVHVAPSRRREVGYERVDKDGYVMVKVRDSEVDGIQRNEPGHHNENYRFKHHIVWEQANGQSVPPGHIIVFADRDKTNFDPSNLVAVPRPLLAVIGHGGYAYHDRASLEAAMLAARLDRARYALECRERPCASCGAGFKPRYAHQRTCDGCLALKRATC